MRKIGVVRFKLKSSPLNQYLGHVALFSSSWVGPSKIGCGWFVLRGSYSDNWAYPVSTEYKKLLNFKKSHVEEIKQWFMRSNALYLWHCLDCLTVFF